MLQISYKMMKLLTCRWWSCSSVERWWWAFCCPLFKLIKMYYWHQNLMKNKNRTSFSVPHSKWKHYWEVMTSCSCFPLCSIAKHFCRSLQRSLKNGLRLAPVLSVMRDGKFKHIAFKSNQDLSFYTKTLLPGNRNKPGKVSECIWWEY